MLDEKTAEGGSVLARGVLWGYRLFPVYLMLLTVALVALNSSTERWTGLFEILRGGHRGDLKWYLIVLIGLVGAVGLSAGIAWLTHRGKPAGLKAARVAYLPLIPSLFMVGFFGAFKAGDTPLLLAGTLGSGWALLLSITAWSRRVEAEVWRRAEASIEFVADEKQEWPVVVKLRRVVSRWFTPPVVALITLGPMVAVGVWAFQRAIAESPSDARPPPEPPTQLDADWGEVDE